MSSTEIGKLTGDTLCNKHRDKFENVAVVTKIQSVFKLVFQSNGTRNATQRDLNIENVKKNEYFIQYVQVYNDIASETIKFYQNQIMGYFVNYKWEINPNWISNFVLFNDRDGLEIKVWLGVPQQLLNIFLRFMRIDINN